jgi:3-phosphoshikimate 1-carboxyvinyltransferase
MSLTDLPSGLDAVVRIPGSKSITHRAIIAASLAKGRSVLTDFLLCEDTVYTIQALRQFGVPIALDGNRLTVEGQGRSLGSSLRGKTIHLGNSGTSFRLLLSVAALCRDDFLLTGTDRMQQRPIGPLVEALNHLGVDVSCIGQDGCPPVRIRARGLRGGKVSISGDQSSQFLSSLLLSGPYADTDIAVEVTGDLVSSPYVEMTIHVMEQFGVRVTRDHDRCFRISSGQDYKAREFGIEGDASSASYFWAAAAITGKTIATTNIYPNATRQGDIRFLEILERIGCVLEKGSDWVTVHGRDLSGVEVDMSDLPDMVPTLAAVALFAGGRTVIRNVAHLRHKESDRLHAVASEWGRIGADIEELPDGLVIHGGRPLSPAVMDPHNDHRLAMSLAIVALRVPHIRIMDKDCVKKSFPTFWNLWDSLQGKSMDVKGAYSSPRASATAW